MSATTQAYMSRPSGICSATQRASACEGGLGWGGMGLGVGGGRLFG